MIEFFAWCTFVVSLAIAALALACWRAGIEYDKWQQDFESKGIKTALEPVVFNNEVVGYMLVRERRSKRA